ncbi:YceI family protein [Nitratireductor sp. ZSWI3]|uniref:YceI family protein n=1 Tax=Nitratireductor sp. ZSWI3 TaxID=2966359 RepID=UPI00214FEDCD|nr:YceI family protein [Nitratireductor sp. ZSWI3]MCR4268174.1 YceI family protein [Nitratireductor sp. ZSWI3]
MHRRSIIFGAAVVLLARPAPAANLDDSVGRYRITASSRIAFTVDQVGGGGLSGSFPQFSGTIDLRDGALERSSVTFRLAPASVVTGESRVDAFLRSDAVFDVARHPEITFRSTRVRLIDASSAAIEGILSARGRSRPETFTATVVRRSGNAVTFKVTGNVLRSPYGMDVGTPIYSNIVRFDMTINGRRF